MLEFLQEFKILKRIIVTLLVFFTAHPLLPEEIYLQNGKRISGRIVGQTLEDVVVYTISGKLNVDKRSIKKIRYVPYSEAEEKKRLAKERAARLAAIRKREELKRQRIAAEKKAEQERKAQELAELEAQIQADKQREAREKAQRAAALRTLVDEGAFENDVEEPTSYWDFTWRSILVPGWGHFYIDRPWMGGFYFGGTLLLSANAYSRYRDARDAMRENHREVEFNYLLALQPDLAPVELRTIYSMQANAKAATGYQNKVNRYNYSLGLLQIFYGIQVLHIIYNGIAWENGLFIVEKESGGDDTFGSRVAILPEFQMNKQSDVHGRPTTNVSAGIRLMF